MVSLLPNSFVAMFRQMFWEEIKMIHLIQAENISISGKDFCK